MSSFDADMSTIIDKALSQGFKHSRTAKQHHQFLAPNGHDIVVTGSTPSDSRSWPNFLAEMRRAGYQDATTSLGDKLQEAISKPQGELEKKPLSVRDVIKDVLRRHSDDGMALADLSAVVKAKRPDIGDSTVSVTLSSMKNKGLVIQMGPARYRLTTYEVKLNGHDHTTLSAIDVLKERKLEVTQPEPAKSEVVQPSTLSDGQLASDLVELDAALAALAKIDSLVRRHRDVVVQLAKLKSLLGGIT